MNRNLRFTLEAAGQLKALQTNPAQVRVRKAVEKTLGLMQTNLRHSGLQTHEYFMLTKQLGFKVFEAYAQNKTPGAYRVFWHYGPDKDEITIVSITAHP